MAGATYSGIGSGGSEFNAGNGHFPAVPYGSGDFNPCTGVCSDNWCDINNYNDPVEVCVSTLSLFIKDTKVFSRKFIKLLAIQECIPVGCVPPACA